MKQKNKFSIALGCALIIFLHAGVNSVATAAMPQLKEHFQTQLTTVIMGGSVCCVALFVASFFGSGFIRKVTPKGALFVGSLCGMIFSLLLALSTNVSLFFLGCTFAGLMSAWGSYTSCIVIISALFTKNRAGVISSLSAMAMLGGASFQFMAGRLLQNYGVRELYLVMFGFCILSTIVNLLFVRNVEDSTESETSSENTPPSESAKPSHKQVKNELFASKTFLLMSITAFFGMSLTGGFSSLFTTYLQSNNIGTALSTTLLSSYTLLAGFLSFFSGYIADRKGYPFYVKMLYSSYFCGIVCAFMWGKTSHSAFLVLTITFLAAASPISSVYNQLSNPLFGKRALTANTKLLSFAYLGSTVMLPLLSYISEKVGFSILWGVLIMLAIGCMTLVLTAIKSKQKQLEVPV